MFVHIYSENVVPNSLMNLFQLKYMLQMDCHTLCACICRTKYFNITLTVWCGNSFSWIIPGPGLFVRHLRVELTQECKSDTNRSL